MSNLTKRIVLGALLTIGLQNTTHTQVLPDSTNDFKVGMFAPKVTTYDSINNYNHCYVCSNCRVYGPVMRRFGESVAHPSSHLKVLSEDGFNIVSPYMIGWADNDPKFTASLLQHIKNNGMQCLLNSIEYYRSEKAVYDFGQSYPVDSCCGETLFNFVPQNSSHNCGYIPNYGLLFDSVFLLPRFRDVIWGHKVTEEAAARHPVPFRLDIARETWQDPNVVTDSEIPVPNVVEAMDNMRLKDPNLRLIVMEASHNGAIRDGLHDMESRIGPDPYSYYQTYEYLTLPNYPSSKRANVFFEGSYMNPIPIWMPWYAYTYDSLWAYEPDKPDTTRHKTYGHYLGQHKTIDWAYKYVDNVHEVINYTAENLVSLGLNPDSNNYQLHTHPDSVLNANFLHFQAYTSIIHKANGIWFWDLTTGYMPDEEHKKNSTAHSRFERDSFPRLYNNFVAPLSRQLRYLVNKNLLTTDLRSHVAYKTDSVEDRCNIIQVNEFDKIGLFERDNDTPNKKIRVLRKNEHYDSIDLNRQSIRAPYSPRYTLRTNGKEDVLIVSNPIFNYVNCDINLIDIAKKDDIIRNAKSYKLLFEANFPSEGIVKSRDYKIQRDTIDWHMETLPQEQYYQSLYSTAIDNVGFGPADVHLFQFGPVDYQWYDQLCDISEEGGAVKASSPLAVDNSGNVYYLNDANQMLQTSVHTDAASSLGVLASPHVQFTVNPAGTILYYANTNLKLCAYPLSPDGDIPNETNISVCAGANIECRNGKVFYVNSNHQIACISESGLQNNLTPQIVSTTVVRDNIGFAVSDDGNSVYFLSTDNHLYRAKRNSTNSWTTTTLTSGTATQFRENTRLHYVNGVIYGIRNSDGRIHRFYHNANALYWSLDWLGSNIAADAGTDIAVMEEDGKHSVYFILNNKLYRCRTNDQYEQLSPTDLSTTAGSSKVALYDDKIIFVGAGNKIHTLSYRHHYTEQADLYIKDTPLDVGADTNNQSSLFYISEDIWVRRQRDGITQHQCETPLFTDGKAFVYVRVRNKSLYPSPENATLTLYWQWANVSASWPAPWDGSMGANKGGRIESIFIPSISGGGDTILEFVWTLPTQRPIDLNGKGHYCLLALIDDGIPINNNTSLLNLIKYNNNVAMRNITILNGGNNPAGPLVIENNLSRSVDYVLRFDAEDATPGDKITDVAEILVSPSEMLLSQFQTNGINITPKGENTFMITGTRAEIQLTLPANTEHHITLQFIPNVPASAPTGKTYRCQVQLLNSKKSLVLTGEEYQIEL